MNTLVIDTQGALERVALYRDEVLDDLAVEAVSTPSLVGRIYKGRVEKVEPALEAAFINIGGRKAGYLGLRDVLPPSQREGATIRDHIRAGQEVLVQVIKDVREDKGVQLTTRITLPGRFLVLTPEEPGVSLSHKIIGSRKRSALGSWIAGLLPEGIGVVLRSEAAHGNPEEIQLELERLHKLWERIAAYRVSGTAPLLVYKEASAGLRMVRRMPDPVIHRICSTSREQGVEVLEYLRLSSSDKPEYLEEIRKERLDADMEDALHPYVQLPGGASLWIEPTRALTVIDVNSGRQASAGDAQNTFLRVNLAAAVEIARQLRIRNLSGMILIDFIDMKSAEHRKLVAEALAEAARTDRMPVSVLGYTQLGILELTRKSEQPPLREVVTKPCDQCEGTGRVVCS
jgi:Rne/Rng family ribonuclease